MTDFRRAALVFACIAVVAATLFLSFGDGPRAATALSVSMVEPAGSPDATNYWPRWRGPSDKGSLRETATRTPGPMTAITQEIFSGRSACPGNGNSSPIIWDDRIFLTTAYEDGGGDRFCACGAPAASSCGNLHATRRTRAG